MSGGAFNYLYMHPERLLEQPSELDELICFCEIYNKTQSIEILREFKQKLDGLKERKDAIQAEFEQLFEPLEDLLHDVEWVASSDYGLERIP